MSDEVVLVDRDDQPRGSVSKLAAHLPPGRLHRAVSVFVYDTSRERMLLQRRATTKYHFAGLWANAACSHPRPGETAREAATRRLREEMGLTVALSEMGSFTYRAADPESGLVEHEYDHVFVGFSDREPHVDAQEADDWKWAEPAGLWAHLQHDERGHVPWLRLAMDALPALRTAGSPDTD